jgi:hypothetical protein
MSNNQQPFQIGQRVVCVKDHVNKRYVYGNEYIVFDTRQCACGSWKINIGVTNTPGFTGTYCCNCYVQFNHDDCLWANSKNFRPINPYSSDATQELIEQINIGDKVDGPVREIVNN